MFLYVFIQDFSTFLLMKDFNRSFAHICSLFCAVFLTRNIAALEVVLEVVLVQCLVKKNKLSLSDCWDVTYCWKMKTCPSPTRESQKNPGRSSKKAVKHWKRQMNTNETFDSWHVIFNGWNCRAYMRQKDSSWLALLYECAEGWQSWTATSNVWVPVASWRSRSGQVQLRL